MRGRRTGEAFHEPPGRERSPLRADGCNHDFLQRQERRARSDAPQLVQPVHGTDARPILEVAPLHEPCKIAMQPFIAYATKGCSVRV